jgi:inactive STAND
MTQQPTSQSQSPINEIQQEVDRNQGQTIGQMHGSQAFSLQEVREGGFFVAGNVIFQNTTSDTIQSASHRTGQEVPALLPYLANRNDQEFELGKAFQQFLRQSLPCPLVCIIHGDEFQSHDKFLERLQRLSIPRLIGLDLSQTVIKEYPLNWPSGLKNLDELATRLCRNLADRVLGYSFASIEEINDNFCKYPGPIIIHTHLLTEDWQQQGFEILNSLLDFWQNWPDLTSSQKLFVCIFIKYQVKRKKQSNKFSCKQLFGFWRSLFKRRRYQHTNDKIRKKLEELSASDLKQRNRLLSTVLSELTDVSRMHVENWVRDEATKQFVGEAMLEKLVDAVGEMFDTWEERTSFNMMSMDDLADNLTHLLKSLTTLREN